MPDEHKTGAALQPQSTEENVYAGVYRALLAGMFLSTALFALGIVRALMHHENIPLTREWVLSHYHWSVVLHGLRTGDPTVIMMVATAVLILTPVVRVLVSIWAFAVDHDRKFVVVTSTVFLIMVITLILGLLGLR
jgi:uncharacterized membrane protein